jgi:hypothetical protein
MLEAILLGLAMALVIEGLVLALAPRRLEDLMAMISQIPFETRRMIGLICVGLGVVAVGVVRVVFGG